MLERSRRPQRRTGSRGARRITTSTLAVAAVATLTLVSCGSSDGATTSSTTSTTLASKPGTGLGNGRTMSDAAVRKRVDELYPPVPSEETADVAGEGCMENAMAGMHVAEATDFTTDTAPDGTYERVYAGKNPRTETSAVPFDQAPTAAEQEKADEFVAQVKRTVEERGWTDPANVIRDGYRPMQQCNSHYINVDAVLDGKDLDPRHPEFVVVEPGMDGKNHFHSVMFMTGSNTGHGPQPFGSLGIWHYHAGRLCMIDGIFNIPQGAGDCPSGSQHYERTPEMLHVSVTGPPFSPAM